nr:hypothetical protein [Angustibacter aerolatus]
MSRPGFVLEVDDRTPRWSCTRARACGSRPSRAAPAWSTRRSRLAAVRDADATIARALREPVQSEPLAEPAAPRHAADHHVRRRDDPGAVDGGARRAAARRRAGADPRCRGRRRRRRAWWWPTACTARLTSVEPRPACSASGCCGRSPPRAR